MIRSPKTVPQIKFANIKFLGRYTHAKLTIFYGKQYKIYGRVGDSVCL